MRARWQRLIDGALGATLALGAWIAITNDAPDARNDQPAPIDRSALATRAHGVATSPRLTPAAFHPTPAALTHVIGTVRDRAGDAVAGALVIARPSTPATTGARAVTTDRAGHFAIVGLPPGSYWFIAVHGGDPAGTTPALPVEDSLDVAITMDLETLPA